jgi:hypothetical protein
VIRGKTPPPPPVFIFCSVTQELIPIISGYRSGYSSFTQELILIVTGYRTGYIA